MDGVLLGGSPTDPGAQRLRSVRRWDPLAFIFFAHGVGLALTGVLAHPLWVLLLTGALALIRLAASWLPSGGKAPTVRYLAAYLSTVFAYAVILADGGTESPFFFWIHLLLGWQVLLFDRNRFLRLAAFNVVAYVVVVVATTEFTPAAVFRLGLLAAFIFTLAIGRWILDRREADVARLDDAVKAIIDDAPMAMAILDADRDTLLYANGAAQDMGIVSRDDMAHLLLDDPARPQRITTLADLVVGSGFRQSPLRSYRHIGSSRPEYRIGFHPRRAGQSRPLVLVYGFDMSDE